MNNRRVNGWYFEYINGKGFQCYDKVGDKEVVPSLWATAKFLAWKLRKQGNKAEAIYLGNGLVEVKIIKTT